MEFNKGTALDDMFVILNQFSVGTQMSPSQSFKVISDAQAHLQGIYNEGLKAGFELKKIADKQIGKN